MIERSSSNQENPFSDGAVLSVRLWTGDAGDPTSESVWKNATSAASVAVDLVNASGGIGVVTAGNLLVSKFSSVPTAILAAKRIQWAISGCTEAGGDGSGSATILIQSVDDYSSEGSSAAPNPSLEQAFPGQILLAEATCKSLENLPGLPLSPPIAGLRELQWRTSENAPSRLQDDQALAQFRMNGGQHRVVVAEHRPQGLVLRMQILRWGLRSERCQSADPRSWPRRRRKWRRLRNRRRVIEARILLLVLRKVRTQREQATKQAAAIRKGLRIGISVEQTHQATAIFREASVAAR